MTRLLPIFACLSLAGCTLLTGPRQIMPAPTYDWRAAATGADLALVGDIERKLLNAEYKRRQAPPGVKIGSRNFGRDRRYPITNAFRTGK